MRLPRAVTACLIAVALGAAEPTAVEIAKQVAAAGTTKPDWWDATRLNYPATIDLSCPQTKGWQPQVAPGAWFWDNIPANPKRWREGAKFWQLVLSNAQAKKLPQAERICMYYLGVCYGELLQDWPRALYWYGENRRLNGPQPEVIAATANAYWRLGSRTLAVQTLKPLDQDLTRHGSVIKLWADLGDYATAYRLADAKKKSTEDVGWFMAGYTAQAEGSWAKALDCFKHAAAANQAQSGRDWKEYKQRADSAIQAISLFETLDLAKVADGTYSDSSSGYKGPVTVAVQVAAHRIAAVDVTKNREDRPATALVDMPAQIIAKQHVKDVDAVLGATVTSEAIVYATAKALRQGQH